MVETYTRTPLEEASYQEALERYHRDGGPVPHEFPEGLFTYLGICLFCLDKHRIHISYI